MLRFSYKAYRRHFRAGYATAGEALAAREGALVRIEDKDGREGYGEIAPVASFGSESLAAALGACEALGEALEPETVSKKLVGYPCSRYALESAMAWMGEEEPPPLGDPWPVCGLVPDLGDLGLVEEYASCHYRAVKFKIGKRPLARELADLERALGPLGEDVALRLDANGGLTLRQTREWLEAVADWPVEFLEQPMPPGEEPAMAALARDYPTALALDESACRADDLKRWRDWKWPGLFVVKPLLSGSHANLIAELAQGADDCVYSSALETLVGMGSAMRVAAAHPGRRLALGFGVERLFGRDQAGWALGAFARDGDLPTLEEARDLWNRI